MKHPFYGSVKYKAYENSKFKYDLQVFFSKNYMEIETTNDSRDVKFNRFIIDRISKKLFFINDKLKKALVDTFYKNQKDSAFFTQPCTEKHLNLKCKIHSLHTILNIENKDTIDLKVKYHLSSKQRTPISYINLGQPFDFSFNDEGIVLEYSRSLTSTALNKSIQPRYFKYEFLIKAIGIKYNSAEANKKFTLPNDYKILEYTNLNIYNLVEELASFTDN